MKNQKVKQKLPAGWNENRVREVIDYYDNQTEAEQLAEHEAAQKANEYTMMPIPNNLVPAVRKLIARRRTG